MTRLSAWKIAGAVLALFAATAIAAPAQTFSLLVDFDGTNGVGPYLMSLVQGPDGQLYGTTNQGGNDGDGTIFKLTLDGSLTQLHSFSGSSADGRFPDAGLVLGSDGNFYGTTSLGGANQFGTIFKITSGGTLTTVYSFCGQTNCTDGTEPAAALVLGIDGSLYGTTNGAGANGPGGTVFKIAPWGTLTTLYSFCAQTNCGDGANPYAGLLQANGNFYGTTYAGGVNNGGTVFKISPQGTLETLYSFCTKAGCADGTEPYAGLVLASDGNVYGTTTQGGIYGNGTVFRLNSRGRLTTLYSFCRQANCRDGAQPYSGLVQATDGNLYGTTRAGGTKGWGTIFSLNSGGGLTILHNFDFYNDGGQTDAGLLQGTNGTLYGATYGGGGGDKGTIFSLSMGLGPFVAFVRASGKVGQTGGILGQGFTGTTSVGINGIPGSFTVVSDSYIRATVPAGATTGYVTVTTPSGTLTSNVPFHVIK